LDNNRFLYYYINELLHLYFNTPVAGSALVAQLRSRSIWNKLIRSASIYEYEE